MFLFVSLHQFDIHAYCANYYVSFSFLHMHKIDLIRNKDMFLCRVDWNSAATFSTFCPQQDMSIIIIRWSSGIISFQFIHMICSKSFSVCQILPGLGLMLRLLCILLPSISHANTYAHKRTNFRMPSSFLCGMYFPLSLCKKIFRVVMPLSLRFSLVNNFMALKDIPSEFSFKNVIGWKYVCLTQASCI